MIQDNPVRTSLTKQVEAQSRKEKVLKAIEMVKEDIELAISRINTARTALNDVIKPYGKKIETIYRNEAITEMRSNQEHSSRQNDETS